MPQPILDKHQIRRYTRRWKVERLFAGLQNFHRIVTRYEYKPQNFFNFVYLASIIILLHHYF